MRMISTSSLISYSVGVRNLIKERQKYLFRSLLTKNPTRKSWIFSFVPQGTTSFAWHTQHHLSFSSTSLPPRAAQMNDVALCANDVLRNDVGLRPTMLRFAQTDTPSVWFGASTRRNFPPHFPTNALQAPRFYDIITSPINKNL